MLAYFPKAYDDELLYSMIARYSIHTGQQENQKAVIQDVFGKKTAVAIPDLPSHLRIFSKKVSIVWPVSASSLIDNHTLANLYVPFLFEKQAQQVLASMKSDFGGNIHTRSGITASSIQTTKYFRYCPVCSIEQKNNLGETYWQRKHQLPCIEVCLKHQCKLIDSEISFYSIQKHHFQAAEAVNKSTRISSILISKYEHKLISLFYGLLELKNIKPCSNNQWTLFYKKLALDSYMMNSNYVDHKAIYYQLNHNFKDTLFEKYLPKNNDNSWLVEIFRKHRKSFHPIRHLMVWSTFLFDKSIEEIFMLVRNFPKKNNSNKGQEFIAKQTTNKSTNEQRKSWLDLCNKNIVLGVKVLRKTENGGSLYAWLYRHDREWLNDNSPKPKRTNLNRYKRDYAIWDEENIALLQEYINNKTTLIKRPRISKAHLIKQLKTPNSVEKHLTDLPKTAKWLELNQENKVDYRKFRLRVACQTLEASNLPIQQWRLLRLASIRKEYVTEDIKHYIFNLIYKAVVVA
ncbi:TnsD family Tn7-like transposition protein [Pseudoalteromonas nigrifaciens]|uniref:TnsD family Tn7-like transposition protein n=1 Tax=Pseudoalteromonas nigrifaciens TaxID=28109 RepID=UPI001867012F|nr:TnsD family Tn7-like transposition protein [Pseudoalteromonas nigrifaciens]